MDFKKYVKKVLDSERNAKEVPVVLIPQIQEVAPVTVEELVAVQEVQPPVVTPEVTPEPDHEHWPVDYEKPPVSVEFPEDE